MNIAVIPARGGSKRIPKKNIIDFCGKPMIAWSIEAAIKSKCFKKIIISTDDDEIAAISREYGADIILKRPKYLSDDFTGTTDVMEHAIQWYKNKNKNEKIKNICCIYATAPFLSDEDLVEGLRLIEKLDYEYVFSATDYCFPIQRSFFINNKNEIEMFYPEHFKTRSQDLTDAFHDAGQFYWGKVDSWLQKKVIFTRHSKPIFLPLHRVQDIDTYEDLKKAKLMFKAAQDENLYY